MSFYTIYTSKNNYHYIFLGDTLLGISLENSLSNYGPYTYYPVSEGKKHSHKEHCHSWCCTGRFECNCHLYQCTSYYVANESETHGYHSNYRNFSQKKKNTMIYHNAKWVLHKICGRTFFSKGILRANNQTRIVYCM